MSGDPTAALAAARLVALLIERLLIAHVFDGAGQSDIVDVAMGGMMATARS